LSPKYWQENDEFRSDVSLIFFHMVEMHYPIRVCRQFSKRTGVPPPLYSTGKELHRLVRKIIFMYQLIWHKYAIEFMCTNIVGTCCSVDRRLRMKQKDWREIHAQYIERWERREK
jgi:hypothetical protein